jgi:hypothetical protein
MNPPVSAPIVHTPCGGMKIAKLAMTPNKTRILTAPPTRHALVLGRRETTHSVGANPNSLIRLATSLCSLRSGGISDSDKRGQKSGLTVPSRRELTEALTGGFECLDCLAERKPYNRMSPFRDTKEAGTWYGSYTSILGESLGESRVVL